MYAKTITQRFLTALVFLSLLLPGCGPPHATAPRGFSAGTTEAGRSAFGSWVAIDSGEPPVTTEGELIAIDRDSLFVLAASSELHTIAVAGISRVTIVMHGRGAQGGLVGWTVLGTLSTASHGAGLVLTAPLWIIVGSAASVSASDIGVLTMVPRDSRYGQPSDFQSELIARSTPYARFPAGLPPGFDRAVLQRKQFQESPPPPRRNMWNSGDTDS